MRNGTKAARERQKRAYERFHILPRDAKRPRTNIKRFMTDEEYGHYLAAKRFEQDALAFQMSVHGGE